MIKELLKGSYGVSVREITKSAVGAGSDTYFVTGDSGRYVLKFPCASEMNHPDAEPRLCEFLLKKGVPVSEFLRSKTGAYLSYDADGRPFHLQKWVEGKVYELNTAPHWLLKASARMLGKIHSALAGYQGLPVGIGEGFFQYMTPESALRSYEAALQAADRQGNREIKADLTYRMQSVSRFPVWEMGLDKLTCQCTHGDYFISQIICGDREINAVIDWTTACVHPVVWEIIRSYVYASPRCKDGQIDIPEFVWYVSEYLTAGKLNNHDIAMMAKLFYYQIAVCDYYSQYNQSGADNRDIYLHQAVFSTKLMKWFEKNVEQLTSVLQSSFVQ